MVRHSGSLWFSMKYRITWTCFWDAWGCTEYYGYRVWLFVKMLVGLLTILRHSIWLAVRSEASSKGQLSSDSRERSCRQSAKYWWMATMFEVSTGLAARSCCGPSGTVRGWGSCSAAMREKLQRLREGGATEVEQQVAAQPAEKPDIRRGSDCKQYQTWHVHVGSCGKAHVSHCGNSQSLPSMQTSPWTFCFSALVVSTAALRFCVLASSQPMATARKMRSRCCLQRDCLFARGAIEAMCVMQPRNVISKWWNFSSSMWWQLLTISHLCFQA